MGAKYVLATISVVMMLVSPVFAFWHPPPPDFPTPPCPYFSVMVNGEWGTVTDPYLFTEPIDKYCDNVTVEVFITNVTDLYGYEFYLSWNPTYFGLKSWTIANDIWTSQFVVRPATTYAGAPPYQQVASATAPSVGVNGTFKLVTLVFHIDNDVCWTQAPYVDGCFGLTGEKASNSCSAKIDLCDTVNSYWRFVPVKPEVLMTPEIEVNWKVGEKFTEEVWVYNVTKMKSIHFEIDWEWRLHCRTLKNYTADRVWLQLLDTSLAEVTIDDDVFPEANRTSSIVVKEKVWDSSGSYYKDTLTLDIVMKPGYPLINGTFRVLSIVFTKLDPWYCGRQPKYTLLEENEHNWTPENATTPIWFRCGYMEVLCPNKACIQFGEITYIDPVYTYMPIPGDLDASGHVDIQDIIIISGFYGYTAKYPAPNKDNNSYYATYYDLNGDCTIDVYDIVIVAKNFCRTTP